MTEVPIAKDRERATPRSGFLPTHGGIAWIGVTLLAVLAPHVFDSRFSLSLMSQMGIAVIFALSYNVLFGQTGLLSFGHAALLGLGGFASIHVLKLIDDGLQIPVALLPFVGAAAGGFAGVVLGYLCTRRAGTAFSMITLGLGEMIAASTFLLVSFFGGEQGISADRTGGPVWYGVDFGPQMQVYYLILVWTVLCAGLMYGLTRTPLGRIALAVADNSERVQFLRFDVSLIRWMMFIASGIFAGVAGALQAVNYEILTTSSMNSAVSASVLVMVYIGGKRSFVGPIAGAVLITFLQYGLGSYTNAWIFYMGTIFLGMVMYAPNGLVGLIEMQFPIIRAGRGATLLGVYGRLSAPALLTLAGAVSIIELCYRVSFDQQSSGPVVAFGYSTGLGPLPLLAMATAVTLVGLVVLRLVAPGVSAAWSELLDAAGEPT